MHWRRFMRLPAPASSSVKPVQLDHARAGLLVDGQPFSGRGFYMQADCPAINCTAQNAVNISGGIVAEFGRIARTDGLNTVTPQHLWCWENTSEIDVGKKSYPCQYPAVMNWVMLYGFADWDPQEQIKVLDGANRYGLKIMYDLSRRGIASNFNGDVSAKVSNRSNSLNSIATHRLRTVTSPSSLIRFSSSQILLTFLPSPSLIRVRLYRDRFCIFARPRSRPAFTRSGGSTSPVLWSRTSLIL